MAQKAQLGQTVTSPGIAATPTGKAGHIQRPRHENGCRKTIVFFRLVGLRKNKERNRSKELVVLPGSELKNDMVTYDDVTSF